MSERRLFFALWPDHRQRESLRDPIKAALAPVEGQFVERANWHVTLVFLGAFPEERIPALGEAAAGVPVEPFRLRFDRLEFWARPRIACLAASAVPAELGALVDALETAAAGCGHRPEDRPYRPHLTVARRARPFTAGPLAQPVTLDWAGFELVESVSGPGGVRYLPLKQGRPPVT